MATHEFAQVHRTYAVAGVAAFGAGVAEAVGAPGALRAALWVALGTTWAWHGSTAIGAGRASQRLRVQAQTLRRRHESLLATTRELVWSVDSDGCLTYLSPSTRALLGHDPRELTGRRAVEVLHPESARKIASAWAAAVVAREGFNGLVLRAVHADGSDRWLDTTGVPVVDSTGRLLGFDGTARPLLAPEELAEADARMRAEIEGFLANDSLRIALQPIIDLASGSVLGAEALSRFPVGRTDVWFRDAAAMGLGPDLELLAIRAALHLVHALPDQAYLSLNISPATLCNPRLFQLLDRADVPLDRLVFEITEHATIDDYVALERPLHRLREHGARIAVDDAGAGYASFRHIIRLQPNVIKLDRDLVHGVDQDLARRALISSLVSYGVQTDCVVVAEGVERPEDLEALTILGVDAGQGFLFAAPTTDPAQWRQWQRGRERTLGR